MRSPTPASEADILLRRLLGFLLKGVNDDDAVVHGRQIDHPKSTSRFPYADFPHIWADRQGKR